MSSVWNDHPELIEQMKTLWDSGKSSTQIAVILGHGLTRNSVVTKVARMRKSGVEFMEHGNYGERTTVQSTGALKLAKSKGFVLPSAGASRDKTKTSPWLTETTEIEPPFRLEDGSLVTVENIRRIGMCRYPLGDPSSESFHFCANATKDGSQYCSGHHKKCFQPQTGISKIDPKIVRNSGINRIG